MKKNGIISGAMIWLEIFFSWVILIPLLPDNSTFLLLIYTLVFATILVLVVYKNNSFPYPYIFYASIISICLLLKLVMLIPKNGTFVAFFVVVALFLTSVIIFMVLIKIIAFLTKIGKNNVSKRCLEKLGIVNTPFFVLKGGALFVINKFHLFIQDDLF